jgi:putative transposase
MAVSRPRLSRLDRVWIRDPIYFITTCVEHRRKCLDAPEAHAICREVWTTACAKYHWQVERYVVMPDHVHFFCAPKPGVGVNS